MQSYIFDIHLKINEAKRLFFEVKFICPFIFSGINVISGNQKNP